MLKFASFLLVEQFVPESTDQYGTYECPLYQSAVRGQGHFVTAVQLPSDQDEQLWVLRGTALLCQLDCD